MGTDGHRPVERGDADVGRRHLQLLRRFGLPDAERGRARLAAEMDRQGGHPGRPLHPSSQVQGSRRRRSCRDSRRQQHREVQTVLRRP